jgi:hypothetical protein
MGKKNKGAAAKPKVAALTAEEFQKLTPEEQVAHLAKVQEENAALTSAVAASKKNGKLPLPSIQVEDDAANDIEGGEYQFTCASFMRHGNVYDVNKLMADAEGKDEKKSQQALAMIAKLVQIKSGVLRRKED